MTTKESGQQVCEKIQKERDRINGEVEINKIWADATGRIVPNYGITRKAAQLALQNQQTEESNEAIQIINRTINQDRRLEIQNQCMQATLNYQSNKIDNTNCPTCNYGVIYDDNGNVIDRIPADEIMKLTNNNPNTFCKIEDVRQTNISDLQNKCIMNTIISDLMKAQADIQAHALARLMTQSQETWDDSASGENFSCQEINQALSQKDYLNLVNQCAQGTSTTQKNIFKYCGNAIDISQNNLSKALKECIIDKTQKTQMNVDSSLKLETQKGPPPQESPPFDVGTLALILIPVIICILLISSISIYFTMSK